MLSLIRDVKCLKTERKEPDKTEKKRTVKYDKTQEILQGA